MLGFKHLASFDFLRIRHQPEFEKLRQIQETRNEIIVNYVQFLVFSSVLVANATTLYLPVAPYRASKLLLGFLAFIVLVRIAVFFYLRGQPPYHGARKYVITTFDIVTYTIAPLLLGRQGAYSWLFLSLFTVCIYSILISLSGLRYSKRVAIYTGAAALVLFLSIFPALMTRDMILPVAMVGAQTLGCVALCVTYNVASLIHIHREAAAKENLARFLPSELVEQVMKDPGLLQRTTERRNATVIFTDIRGFTSLSEKLSPEEVVAFLNEFLEEMTGAIMDHQGMLDKYIGDAVMGVFGVPFHTEGHALRALQAALDMRVRLERLNATLLAKGLPALSIGIGLHTGDLLIGAIGSTRRLDYTVIGDTVNVASRIEGMTRSYPVEILLSDATRVAIANDAILHRVATVTVKNRVEPLTLWSPDLPRDEA